MERDYEELVREGYEAWNRGDRSWVLEHMSTDVEWVPAPDDPDRRSFVGYAGVQEFWEQWRAAVGELAMEPLEVTVHGSEVLAVVRRRGIGTHSGLEVADDVIQLFSFGEDGRCFRVREFYDRAEATEAMLGAGEHVSGPGRPDA